MIQLSETCVCGATFSIASDVALEDGWSYLVKWRLDHTCPNRNEDDHTGFDLEETEKP